jgi:hypothetical protein
MAIATGIFKQLVIKKQAALGTKATAASAQLYRRVTSSIDLKKAIYASNEIRPSSMVSDERHGIRSVSGTISGELSVGTYSALMASALRSAAWTATVTTGAIITVTAAVTAGAAGTFTRSAGSYLTDGFKVGMVMRWTGWATTGVPNNAHNFLITALSATVMTVLALDGVAIGAKAAGDSVTGVSAGKTNQIPQTAQVKDYYTIEHNYADIVQSEQFTDCIIGGIDVKLPSTGIATIDIPIMGLNMDVSTSAYFTSPTAASTGKVTAAVNGAVFVAGTKIATITSMDFSVAGNWTAPGGIVGSNVDPDLFPGVFKITGNMSVLFDTATMRDYFLAETEVAISAAFTVDNTATADFIAVTFPRAKINGADKNDGETGLTMTMPFSAIENVLGGTGTSSVASAIMIQDSVAI